MEVSLPPGKYAVAVSGGVDSVVLLDALSNLGELDLVIAHFDHGMRADSDEDAKFVEQQAKHYGLPFEVGKAKLGPAASEEAARDARYEFFNKVKEKYKANAVITAHHQDDLIETALINMLRGSGSRGLFAISDNPHVLRPMLQISKADILKYAKDNNLQWRDDPTNNDVKYLRNRLRAVIQKELTKSDRQKLLGLIEKTSHNYKNTTDALAGINNLIFVNKSVINRGVFINLPSEIGAEVLVRWLRSHKISADHRLINRLSVVIKTGKPGSRHNLNKNYDLILSTKEAGLEATGK